MENQSPFNEFLNKLKQKRNFEEVKLPSRNLTYEDIGLSIDQPIHVRPMTMNEEKILSTSRLIKSGQALDKIFESCIQENIDVGKLLTVDRTYLLFFIRGISYGKNYEVTLKCPSCNESFDEEIDLDSLSYEYAEDSFSDNIKDELPDAKVPFWYRYPRGNDEKNLNRYRQQMNKAFGNNLLDDTIIKRNIMLINKIGDFSNQMEIEQIINNLSVVDSNYIRDVTTEPSFGLNTKIALGCPMCYHNWEMELPIDTNFFFPKTKKQS